MQLEEELAKLKPPRDVVLTVGVFDGVHLGHRQLIQEVKDQARKRSLLSGVVTFHPHPRLVLSPQTKLTYLTSLEERSELIAGLGIDLIATLSFSAEFAQLSAYQFLELLQKYLRMQGLVVGPDFALGRNREGDIVTLRALAKKLGFSLQTVAPLVVDGIVVSSSAIREALMSGDMPKAAKLLGRNVTLSGTVIRGVERGRVLGFPTANLVMDANRALPADGVYMARAHASNAVFDAVTNIGRRPTFDDGERMIEVHLLDFEGDLYGQNLKVELLQRLRGEKRFDSVEALKAQIRKDIEATRAILAR